MDTMMFKRDNELIYLVRDIIKIYAIVKKRALKNANLKLKRYSFFEKRLINKAVI